MPASAGTPSGDRLVAIGLPPRPAGWVPDQPPSVRPVGDDTSAPASDHGAATPSMASATAVDRWRLAAVGRLPPSLAARLERMSNGALGCLLIAVALAVVLAVTKLHGHGQPAYPTYTSRSYGGGATAAASSNPVADGSSIVVDVAGRVRHPGLVTLPVGAREADAIRAAGGALHRRDLVGVDLAARVVDGQLLMVGPARSGAAAGGSAAGPVSLSTASIEQLETLPGVGPVTAQKIIDWRTAHGGFTSVSQLQQVAGIGPARYAELSPLVSP